MGTEQLKKLEEHEQHDTKYMRELEEYVNAYFFALINEIYTGVAINLGLSANDAYKLAKSRPDELQKANFFKNIFNKFKGIFKYKIPKFRYKKKIYGDGEPMTPDQWDKFNRSIDNYWKEHANKVAEDFGIKSYMLGRDTAEYKEKKKPYKRKSLFQMNFDQYDGDMPKTIAEAYKNYDFTNAEKKAINKSYSGIAMYVSNTSKDIQEAIRQNVQIGMDNNKSSVEIGSDLYWNVEKNENLNNKYTAESLRRDWNRIAATEIASMHNQGQIAPYENQAMESMKDPSKAVYMVRTGGTCDFCLAHRGTILRLIPADIADPSTDKLSDIGIKDPHTNLYTFNGQSNVGRKQQDWFLCCPAHPYNKATLTPINLGKEEYNQKTDEVEFKPKKEQFVPQMKDYSYRSREEKKDRKPKKIGGGLVTMNNNTYRAVDSTDYNTELEKWKKDPSKPIPVNRSSPQYKQIFWSAE